MEFSLKAAKDGARKKEDFLNSLINAIPIPVFYEDRDGKYMGCNEAFETFFGKKREQIIGKSVFDINPPKLAETYYAKDIELFKDGGIQRYHSRVKNASGQLRDVIFYKSLYAENAGTPQGLIGAVLDETERKQAALELKESEKRFRAIFDNAMDGILVANASTKKFVMANRGICDMLGYSADELLKLSVSDIHPEKDLPNIVDIFGRQARKEFRLAENLPVKRKDGTVFYADISSAPMSIGTDNFLVGIFRDITKRRKAEIAVQKAHDELEERVKERTEKLSKAKEELKLKSMEREQAGQALRESEVRFRALVETTSDWVWEVDTEGLYTYVNPRVKDVLGYAAEEVIGKRPFDFMPPAEAERIGRVFRAMAASGSVIEGLENTNLHKDGRPVVLETSGAPFFDAKGNLQGYRGIDRDITERKKSEEALQQTYQDLRNTQGQLIQAAKLASIGQLSAGVAHELNQPLMVIRNKAQLIQRAIKKNRLEEDDLNGQLTAIERNTKRMMNIINHLRTFSRQSPLDFHPVDINRVIENTFLMMGEQLRRHDIEVKKDLAANLPGIQGDANQLEQVFLNLIINAGDAIETAGNNRRIEIITRISDEVKGAIEILTKDTGGGISKECQEKIFDPFFTTKEVGKGTGLGLSISYGIVKDHKGEIEVAETGPEGTTFRIRLPIASNEKSGNRK